MLFSELQQRATWSTRLLTPSHVRSYNTWMTPWSCSVVMSPPLLPSRRCLTHSPRRRDSRSIFTNLLSSHAHSTCRRRRDGRYSGMCHRLLPSNLPWPPPFSPQDSGFRLPTFVSRIDRYLAGWKARLLSTGGRLTLVNAVLSSLPVYYMSAMLLPKTVTEAIDSRRRSFLWTGEEKCHGSQCLVAWEKIGQDKMNGGLGVKNLACQKHCCFWRLSKDYMILLRFPGKNGSSVC